MGFLEDFYAEHGAQAPTAAPPAEDPEGGFFNTLWELGGDALAGLADLFDRPGRAVRQLVLRGDPGQAFSAIATPFLPKFLEEFLGIDESEPYFTSDFLAEQDIASGTPGPLGITQRGALGFVGDILLDPLTFGAGGLLGKAGRALTGGKGVINTVKGRALAKLMELEKRGGLAGGLSGGLLGAGAKMSRRLRLRGVGDQAELIAAQAEQRAARRHIRDIAEQEAVVRQRTLELNKDFSPTDWVDGVTDRGMTEALRRQGLLPGVERLPGGRFKVPGKFGGEVPDPSQLGLFERMVARKESQRLFDDAVREAKRTGGPAPTNVMPQVLDSLEDEVSNAWRKYTELNPTTRQQVQEWFTGSPEVLANYGVNLGKLQIEAGQFGHRNILQEEWYDRFLIRTGRQHLRQSLDPESLAMKMTDELADALGMGKEHVSVPGAQRLLAQAKQSNNAKARTIAFDLEKYAAETGLFRNTPVTLGLIEGHAFADAASSTDLLQKMAKNPNWARPAKVEWSTSQKAFVPVVDDAAEMVTISPAAFPKQLRDQFSTTQRIAGPDGKMHTVTVPFQYPRRVATEIQGFAKQIHADPDGIAIKKAVQAITSQYQGWTLSLFPATWLRNLVSNLQMNFYAGAGLDVRDIATAGKLLKSPSRAGTIHLGAKSAVGESLDAADLFYEAHRRGVYMGGLAATEVGEAFNTAAFDKRPFWRRFLSADATVQPLARAGFGVMNYGDNLPRMSHFVGKLRKGATFEEAAQSVKKYLYAGEVLTDAEKTWLRPIFPFMGWAKFNLPLQARNLIEHPGKTAMWARMKVNIDRQMRLEVPDEAMPEFISSQVGIPVGKNAKGEMSVWLGGSWIPMAQLGEISSPRRFFEFAISSMAPYLKNPIEGTINYNTFYKSIIERYPGETESFLGARIGKKTAHQLRMVRLLSEIDRVWFKDSDATRAHAEIFKDLGLADKALRHFRGRRVVLDLPRAKKYALGRYDKNIRLMERTLKRLVDPAQRKQLEAQIRWVKMKRMAMRGWDPLRDARFN